jgi:hypothetical protein
MGHEELTERCLLVKHADHLGLAHSHHIALSHRLGGCQSQRLADQAALAEEIARPEDRDDGLLALLGGDADLYPALLNIVDGVGNRGLAIDDDVLGVARNAAPAIDGRKKLLGIEYRFGSLGDNSLPSTLGAG